MTQSEGDLIDAVRVILEADPPMTITQLFFRLVSLPSNAPVHIPNTSQCYVKFMRLMTRARVVRDSRIDWRRIVEPNDAIAGGRIVDANLDGTNRA